MKIARKNMGLVLVSFIALSFNSHFAQAARKTQELFRPTKVYAFKLDGECYRPLGKVEASPLTVKKTAVKVDRERIFIGGYVVNSSEKPVNHVRIYPTFVNRPTDAEKLAERLNHDELNIGPKEIRRFVIVRPISEVKSLLETNVPIAENCILNCQVL